MSLDRLFSFTLIVCTTWRRHIAIKRIAFGSYRVKSKCIMEGVVHKVETNYGLGQQLVTSHRLFIIYTNYVTCPIDAPT